MLDGLDDEQWSTPSLCIGWSVHDVAAHLTMPFSLGVPALIWRMAKARGNFDRVSDDFAKSLSTTPGSQLSATLRMNANNRFTPPGLGPEAPLTDIVVHGLDMGIPVGHPPAVSAEAALTILTFLQSSNASRGFVPKGRLDGLRFECLDVAWMSGSGHDVRGSAVSLILAMTGRTVGLSNLDGEGVAELGRRLRSLS